MTTTPNEDSDEDGADGAGCLNGGAEMEAAGFEDEGFALLERREVDDNEGEEEEEEARIPVPRQSSFRHSQ